MTVLHRSVTVGTAAVSLTAGVRDTLGFAPASVSRSLVVQVPAGGATVLIGGAGVSAASYGVALAPGSEITLDLTPTDEPFAVVASGSTTVSTLHLGV